MRFLVLALTLTAILSTQVMAAEKLVAADDRIKTLVYDTSEVYRIVSRAGFQTTLEFNADETIDTISIGDSIGWQLTPAGRRLFIKPLHKSGITNLSVITSRRSYQFELVATSSTSLNSSHSYVVKFYYPEGISNSAPVIDPSALTRNSLRPVSPTTIPQLPTSYAPAAPAVKNSQLPGETTSPFATSQDYGQQQYIAPAPAPVVNSYALPPVQPKRVQPQQPAQTHSQRSVQNALAMQQPTTYLPPLPAKAVTNASNNYNYTLTGPDSIAPLKVYDNGQSTFLQFGNLSTLPRIFVVGTDGTEYPMSTRTQNGMVVIDAIAPKISIKQGSDTVFVYNENKSLGY